MVVVCPCCYVLAQMASASIFFGMLSHARASSQNVYLDNSSAPATVFISLLANPIQPSLVLCLRHCPQTSVCPSTFPTCLATLPLVPPPCRPDIPILFTRPVLWTAYKCSVPSSQLPAPSRTVQNIFSGRQHLYVPYCPLGLRAQRLCPLPAIMALDVEIGRPASFVGQPQAYVSIRDTIRTCAKGVAEGFALQAFAQMPMGQGLGGIVSFI